MLFANIGNKLLRLCAVLQKGEDTPQTTADGYLDLFNKFGTGLKGNAESVGASAESFLENAYGVLKIWMPFLMVAGVAAGILIALFATRNNRIRKMGIVIAAGSVIFGLILLFGGGYVLSAM